MEVKCNGGMPLWLTAFLTRSRLLIPAHYDLYDANGLNPAIFVDTLHRLNPTQRFHMFVPGECYILQK